MDQVAVMTAKAPFHRSKVMNQRVLSKLRERMVRQTEAYLVLHLHQRLRAKNDKVLPVKWERSHSSAGVDYTPVLR